MPSAVRSPRVVIIGAGFGGVAAAAALVRAGMDDVLLLERADRAGGVWRENTYPGCACDIPAPLYSFSFAPNPTWSSRFPPQREILAYLDGCIDRFGLRPRLRTGHEVTEVRWSEDRACWQLAGQSATGEPWQLDADVVVPAVGQLSRPAMPALPGASDFTGPSFHTAWWNHEVDLRGARVGVIGTGASAIQVVPAIAGTAAHVTVFQRSAPWTLPKPARRYGRARVAAYRRWPALMALPRAGAWSLTVITGRAVAGGRLTGAALRALSTAQRRAQVPDPALRAAVTPHYPMGCKRVLFTSDWYPALRRPDVQLVTTPIERLTSAGVRTRDGTEHLIDVLIHSTGFEAAELLVPLHVQGRDGVHLHHYWAQGAHAYLGMCVPGFPNLVCMYGPNTNTGNTSVIYFLEAQARYVVQFVQLLARRRALDPHASLEVRAPVEAAYDALLQQRLATSVWTSCDSWYRGPGGRIVTNWPGPAAEYARRTRRLDPSDFEPATRPAAGPAAAGRPAPGRP